MNKHILSIALFCMTLGTSAQSSTPLPTNDSFEFTGLYDEDYEDLEVIPIDGTSCIQTVGLTGESIYSAYNLDITLPFGLEVVKEDGEYLISMSDDFSIYARRAKDLAHTVSGTVINNNVVRVACFSGKSAELRDTEGDLFEFTMKVNSPYIKPGSNIVKYSGMNLTTSDAQKYVPEDFEAELTVAEGQVSVDVTVSAGKYSTLVLPFDAEIPAGVAAYAVSAVEGTSVKLQPVEALAAYTPYILYSETGYAATLSGDITAANYESTVDESGVVVAGALKGAVKPQDITAGHVLQTLDGEQKFYATGGQTFAIPSGKCWLETGAEARAYSFVIEDTQTVITAPQMTETDSATYNLAGLRTNKTQKGIRVQKGKKVLY